MGNTALRIFLLLSSLISQLAFSKIVYYGSETEVLSLAYDNTTILRFDEEVKTISQATKFAIEPADPTDPNYRMLSIKPRFREGKDKVTFILANDSVVSLRLDTIGQPIPEKTDNFYDLKSKELKIDPLTDGTKGTEVSELELMKAMIRSDAPIGYNVRSLIRTVNSGANSISAQLIQVYTGPRFNGYIFSLVNNSNDKQYAIDLKSLTLGKPNLALLSQVDEKILQPTGADNGKDKTYLRIVAKPTSVYSAITLPIEPIAIK